MDTFATTLDFINTKNKRSLIREWYDTYTFINTFIRNNFMNKNLELSLLNYGDNKIIYLLKADESYYTLTVSQPALEYGMIKKEYNTLKNLSRVSKDSVLKPSYYYTDGSKELYLSDYSYDSRVITRKNNNFGLYISEQNNKFQKLSHLEENMIVTSMIATLIRLYNHNKNLGLCSCDLSEDFILKKDWEVKSKTLQNTLDNMKLITARDTVNISFKEYMNLLRKQLISKVKDSDIVIVKNSERNLVSSETIENGIKLGLKYSK